MATGTISVTSGTCDVTRGPTVVAKRLESLDIFRGLTIAAMILVNDPGNWDAVYPQLLHSEWNGCTFTDLIFPFFLFIVGVSMVFSFAARRERGDSKKTLLIHGVKRSAIIFAIGLFLNGAPFFPLASWRIMGVLQRIALAYLATSLITLYFGRRGRVVWTFGLLAGYWAAMKLIPVPGFGAGVLTPEGNLAAWLDREVLYNHLYVAHSWDPEGLLSTIPAVGTTLLGVFCGEWLRSARAKATKVAGMIAAGALAIAAGEICNRWFPINKNLWTSSYVLFTAGWALLALAACYWTVEVRGWRKWGVPGLIYGTNAIVVYAASSLVGKISISVHIHGELLKTWAYEKFFAPLAAPIHASLLWASAYVIAFWVLAWAMYRKRIFIKV